MKVTLLWHFLDVHVIKSDGTHSLLMGHCINNIDYSAHRILLHHIYEINPFECTEM